MKFKDCKIGTRIYKQFHGPGTIIYVDKNGQDNSNCLHVKYDDPSLIDYDNTDGFVHHYKAKVKIEFPFDLVKLEKANTIIKEEKEFYNKLKKWIK